MNRKHAPDQYEALRQYVLGRFPAEYRSSREEPASGHYHFLLDLAGKTRMIIFTRTFWESHTAEEIPSCLDRYQLVEKLQGATQEIIVVDERGIEEVEV